jgi:endonuclease/exonuclease/phosphatase family metal-dependent hydrolase
MWTVAVTVLGQFGVAGCLGWAAARPVSQSAATPAQATRPAAAAARRGWAAGGGLLAFVVLIFGYYAAYDLGMPNRWVPIVAAAAIAAAALHRPSATVPPPHTGWRLAAAASVVTLLAVIAPLWQATSPPSNPSPDGLRVAAYNIRMGFGLAGTMTIAEQADTLASLDAHVIALSEVDRGWFLNGGRDDLRLLADRLGMRYYWAPAADELWGDAVLTDLPVSTVRNHPLPTGGPTAAQALEVAIRWNSQDITVIATHTQPPPGWNDTGQAQRLAALVTETARNGNPVILAGDLNMRPADPVYRTLLSAGLRNAFGEQPHTTIPSPGAPQQIDHILVTPDLVGTAPANPDVPWSDHRPIAVTLLPTS